MEVDMTKKKRELDSTLKDKLSKMLDKRLKELSASISDHDTKTTQALPKNSKEANPIKGEMEIVEALEKHEVGEIFSVKQAIQKMADGDYGVCDSCNGDITIERLLARPWSVLCVACKAEKENEK